LWIGQTLIDMNPSDNALRSSKMPSNSSPPRGRPTTAGGPLYREKGRTEDAKRELKLYRELKEMKEKVRQLYRDLQVQPEGILSRQSEE
jgi:hypothetical protein